MHCCCTWRCCRWFQTTLHAGPDSSRRNDGIADTSIEELQQQAVARPSQFASQGKHWHDDTAAAIDLPSQWEVVEVKNHCPFIQVHNPVPTAMKVHFFCAQCVLISDVLLQESKKGRKRWRCRDTGPREAIPLQYVGQLQLEMMCTGLRSALLVSRSSCNGTNVFRMFRNDQYCKCLLLHASRFKAQFTSGRPPPPNFFASWATHHELCNRTSSVQQRCTTLVCHLPSHCCLGQAQPMFL